MSIRVFIVPQHGDEVTIGVVASLDAALQVVKNLEAQWNEWDGLDYESSTPAVQSYEGCDVYATDEASGQKWWLDEDDGWELQGPPTQAGTDEPSQIKTEGSVVNPADEEVRTTNPYSDLEERARKLK